MSLVVYLPGGHFHTRSGVCYMMDRVSSGVVPHMACFVGQTGQKFFLSVLHERICLINSGNFFKQYSYKEPILRRFFS